MLADLCFHFPEVRRLFDTADRIARDLGETVPPSEHLFGPVPGGDEKLWSTATAVNVVLNAQWALYQVLTRLGLRPDAVLGPQQRRDPGPVRRGRVPDRSGARAQARPARGDHERLRVVGRLARGPPGGRGGPQRPRRGPLPRPGRRRRRRRDGQLPAPGRPGRADRRALRASSIGLRSENILLEELPFSRAYHTPSFRPVVGPIAEFFDQMSFRPPSVPIYSCASRGRMPGDPDAIRELAVAQWTQTVAFRETIEAMHADGLRLFIDVGARGNLAGFVEDTLRGKPSFAVAANLPRRGGLTQLNHLVAATFAQGATLKTDYLYARRRPRAIDWNAPEPASRARRRAQDRLSGNAPVGCAGRAIALHGTQAVAPGEQATAGTTLDQRPARIGTISASAITASATAMGSRTTTPRPGPPSRLLRLTIRAVSRRKSRPTRRAGLSSWNGDVEAGTGPSVRALRGRRSRHAVLPGHDAGVPANATRGHGGLSRAPPSATPLGHDLDQPAPAASPGAGAMAPDHKVDAGSTAATAPGAWAGEVRRLVPGAEVETLLVLDAHDDPIAQHHTLGGRKISALDPSLLGLPVLPFAVMAEMTAQVAALVVDAGLVLTGLKDVRAHKWVRYEEQPVYLELRGHRVSSPDDDARLGRDLQSGHRRHGGSPAAGLRGDRGFRRVGASPAAGRAPGHSRTPVPASSRPGRSTTSSGSSTARSFRRSPGWGTCPHKGSRGACACFPSSRWSSRVKRRPFTPTWSSSITSPSCWAPGASIIWRKGTSCFRFGWRTWKSSATVRRSARWCACQITIHELERHRIRVEAQFVRPDGTVWMRINDWEDWRFHWPGRYRDSFRQPRDYLVGEELPLDDPAHGPPPGARPSGSNPRPTWAGPSGATCWNSRSSGPRNARPILAEAGSEQQRSQRLWGRIAAKEAARRLWNECGRPAAYPADLAIVADDARPARLTQWDSPAWTRLPAISIAHADGVAVALAALDPDARVGIDVEPIVDRPAELRNHGIHAGGASAAGSLAGLEPGRVDRAVLVRQGSRGQGVGPGHWRLVRPAPRSSTFDRDTGVIHVRLAPELLPALAGRSLR